METSAQTPTAKTALLALDWGAVCTWLLGFGLILYLGLAGGGYDPLVHDQVGIAIWWIGLAAVAVGAIPRQRIGPLAWCAIGLLAAFAVWTALSLTWTESDERTIAELARVLTYVGAFGLAVFARGRDGARLIVSAVAAAIVVISVVALLSRLHPAWFSSANQTAQFLEIGRERLSYPLNYWNAAAALIAIGMPLILFVATSARHTVVRAVAAATMPALMLTALFTLSRGGIAALFLTVAVFIAFTPDRLPRVLTALLAGAGGALLVALAIAREPLRHGLSTNLAHEQGDEMLVWTIVVCVVVGLLQAAISVALGRGMRPAWTRISRRNSLIALGAAVAIGLVALVAVNAPSRASNAWDEFKLAEVPGAGTERLGKATGESRYQFWSSAVREAESDPLTGTGSGTFEFWWTRDGDTGDIVRDAHSLYFQTLGELGVVGLVLLLGFALLTLVAGGRRALRADARQGPALAAALAGCVALWATAIFDWMWQVPVLPVAMLLLAAVLVTDEPEAGAANRYPFRPALRIAFAAAALIVIVAIAIPLATTSLIRQSQAEANAGNLDAALSEARSAQNVMPSAAGPRLQQALLLESAGDLPAAAAAAAAATEREATNWRPWLVRSRIEAQRGNADAAISYYERARGLNPTSSLFSQR
jgi:O-antigen ligase/polysaccharide polymerase Wzy-like membrane protein